MFRQWGHYAWVILGLTLVSILTSSGVRAMPGVLIKPLQADFGWDLPGISLAAGIGLVSYGLGGPLAGAMVDRFGPRRVLITGMMTIGLGLVALVNVRELWQFQVLWGLLMGLGTGSVTNVLGAAVANRWFRQHRNMIVGLMSASASMGQMILLPTVTAITEVSGWRSALSMLAIAAMIMIVPLWLFMRNQPSDMGLRAFGDDGTATAAARQEELRKTPLRQAVRTVDFWLLAGSFFICGYTSNGMVGTHLMPHAVEHGFTAVTAASAVGLMGLMNVFGTIAAGWMTDRYDNRRLLAAYYGFRAVSLAMLPFIIDVQGLYIFALIYGLDWLATVPPTTNLVASIFGRGSMGTIYGWIWFGHMVGAAIAAYVGGLFRDMLGDYHLVFLSAALMGFVAVAMTSRITPQQTRRAAALAAARA